MRMGSAVPARRVAGLLLTALALAPVAVFAAGSGKRLRASSDYARLPLNFEENTGQTDERVRYISRGAGYTLFLTPTETVLSLTGMDRERKTATTSLRMSFAGSREASVQGKELQTGRSQYFIGSDATQWRSVRHFGRVTYETLYPGIDAVFYGNQKQMEYDFIVAPGADPKQIRLKFDGVRSVSTASNGDLVLHTELGDVRQLRPVIYQEVKGKRKTIDGRYVVNGKEASFEVASYDRRKALVIDPVLAWSSFWGGAGSDTISGIAVDSAKNVIVVGSTASADFSAAIRFPGVVRGGASDAFITKFTAAGGAVTWSAFYGGAGLDEALGVAVDSENSIYFTGRTDSQTVNGLGFPLVTAIQNTLGGATDAFVAKLSADGTQLGFSTYLGGFGEDSGNDIAVDAELQPVVVGTTASTNFWATRPYAAFNGGVSDAFATKLTAAGNTLVWSTYLGGSAADAGNGVAVDAAGATYITGATRSFSFPRTAGVVQGAIGSQNVNNTFIDDGFATKISATGTVEYSTFLGGSAYDAGVAIAVDTTGNAYIFGDTESANYPVASPYQSTYRGNRDTFLTKLNPMATARVFSTYLGGTGSDLAGDIAVLNGIAFLAGGTTSTNFPVKGALQPTNAGAYDAFVVQVEPAGTSLTSSTFIGGLLDDVATGIALDSSQNIYVGGYTTSFNYPAIGGAQLAFAGVQDGFVTKLSNCAVTLTPSSAQFSSAAQAGLITIAGPADCVWNPQVSASWITVTSTSATAGDGTLAFAITANPTGRRTGTITIAGVSFTIDQLGAPLASGCVYPISPNSVIALASGLQGNFALSTVDNNCAWTTRSSVPWIQAFPGNGTTSATVTYTVFPNFGTGVRTGTITVTALGVSQTYTITQASSGLTENQRFVTLLYSNYFGRYPSQTEIDFHTAILTAGGSRGIMAAGFFNALEFQQGGRFVAGLYVGLLDRNPDFGGWLFQRNALAVNYVTQDSLVSNFLNSTEFQQKYGPLTNEQFVQLLYQQIFGRPPGAGELAFHAGLLNAGTITRVQTATNFLNSDEFRVRLNSRLSAWLLYATLLQRGATSDELLTRQAQLDAGTAIATLTTEFIASVEFQLQLL